MSAPNSSGRCSTGVQKQLSTTSSDAATARQRCQRRRGRRPRPSGFDGVSRNRSRVVGRIAASQAAGSVSGDVARPSRRSARTMRTAGRSCRTRPRADDVVATARVRLRHDRLDRRHAARQSPGTPRRLRARRGASWNSAPSGCGSASRCSRPPRWRNLRRRLARRWSDTKLEVRKIGSLCSPNGVRSKPARTARVSRSRWSKSD